MYCAGRGAASAKPTRKADMGIRQAAVAGERRAEKNPFAPVEAGLPGPWG
jgi:hypothetical protein